MEALNTDWRLYFKAHISEDPNSRMFKVLEMVDGISEVLLKDFVEAYVNCRPLATPNLNQLILKPEAGPPHIKIFKDFKSGGIDNGPRSSYGPLNPFRKLDFGIQVGLDKLVPLRFEKLPAYQYNELVDFIIDQFAGDFKEHLFPMLKEILKKVEYEKVKNSKDPRLLYQLVQGGREQQVKIFLQNSPKEWIQFELWGSAPLFVAKTKGMVELLIKHGANPNAKNGEGKTPLETIGGMFGHNLDALEALLDGGAEDKHSFFYDGKKNVSAREIINSVKRAQRNEKLILVLPAVLATIGVLLFFKYVRNKQQPPPTDLNHKQFKPQKL